MKTKEIIEEIYKILDDEFQVVEKEVPSETAAVVYVYKQIIKRKIKDLKEKEE